MRKSAKGGQKRARGGTYCRDVRKDTVNGGKAVNDEWSPTGPNISNGEGDGGHEGTEEAGNCYGDDTEEIVEKADQRRGIERGQGNGGTGGCR